jgi:hypothetical protein
MASILSSSPERTNNKTKATRSLVHFLDKYNEAHVMTEKRPIWKGRGRTVNALC